MSRPAVLLKLKIVEMSRPAVLLKLKMVELSRPAFQRFHGNVGNEPSYYPTLIKKQTN